jgi:uncharacterized protein
MTTPTAEDIRATMNAENELQIRVVPGAKVARAAIENGALKLWIKTPPEDGKATKAAMAATAALLGLAARDVTLVSGMTSRTKRVHIEAE